MRRLELDLITRLIWRLQIFGRSLDAYVSLLVIMHIYEDFARDLTLGEIDNVSRSPSTRPFGGDRKERNPGSAEMHLS